VLFRSLENDQMNKYLSRLIQSSVATLEESLCTRIADDGKLEATTSGNIASYYYLTHTTMRIFHEKLRDNLTIENLIDVLASASEYAELPVRHNEDQVNSDLSKDVPFKVNPYSMDSPHTKCNLLLQAHYSRMKMPMSDYVTDLKSVLDQCFRIMQAMLDFCADNGWLSTSLSVINLMQMTCQACWLSDCELLNLPHVTTEFLSVFFNNSKTRIDGLPRLIEALESNPNILDTILNGSFSQSQIANIKQVVDKLPVIEVSLHILGELGDKKSKLNVTALNAVELYPDQEYTLSVDLKRLNRMKIKDSKAHTFLSKPKDENWIIVLGDFTNNELLALKRVSSVKAQQNVNLQFCTPNATNVQQKVFFYLMSDTYLGLDQQYEINIKIIDKKN